MIGILYRVMMVLRFIIKIISKTFSVYFPCHLRNLTFFLGNMQKRFYILNLYTLSEKAEIILLIILLMILLKFVGIAEEYNLNIIHSPPKTRGFLFHLFYYYYKMNKILSIFFVLFVYLVSQVFTYYQLQGHLFNKWIKDNPMIMAILSVPIGYYVVMASRTMIDLWDGQTWPNRLIGFSFGVIVFTIMSWFLLKEPLTLKTAVCLFLCLIILLIQFLWK